jgi:hypothetical protein
MDRDPLFIGPSFREIQQVIGRLLDGWEMNVTTPVYL